MLDSMNNNDSTEQVTTTSSTSEAISTQQGMEPPLDDGEPNSDDFEGAFKE